MFPSSTELSLQLRFSVALYFIPNAEDANSFFFFFIHARLPLPYLDTVYCFFSDPLCCRTTRVTERKTHKEMSANRSDFFVNQSTGCLPVNMNNKGKIRKSGRETHTMAAKPRVSTEIKVYLERRSRHGL
jgi:hypothetical protein